MSTPTTRPRLLQTTVGTHRDAFGATEWMLLATIATIWGSSFVFMAIGLESLRPGVIATARVGLGALALALVPRARRPLHADAWPRVALLGVIWMGVPLLLFPVAQQWIDSSVAGMLNGAMPLTTALWATLLLRQLPGRAQLIGLCVGFVGVMAVSLPEVPLGGLAPQGTSQTAAGVGLVLFAVLLYGLSANLAVPLQQQYGALPVLLRVQLVALAVIAPVGLWQLPDSTFAWGPVLAMLPLGLLGTGLAFVLMTTLVGRVGGPRGSVAIYFVPLVAIALGMIVRGESLHPLAAVGTGLVVAGAWITSRRETLPPPPAGRA